MSHRLSPLAVYCGAASGGRRSYTESARNFGRAMATHGIGLVYGGGKVGLMGEVADAMISAGAGARVVGIITTELMTRELGHNGIGDLRIVDTMHERKKAMADLARGFVALPGGVGTFDELFEVMAWAQLAIHDHPIGLLNVDGFYDGLISFLRHVEAEKFLRIDVNDALVVDADPERLLERMAACGPRGAARRPVAPQR